MCHFKSRKEILGKYYENQINIQQKEDTIQEIGKILSVLNAEVTEEIKLTQPTWCLRGRN